MEIRSTRYSFLSVLLIFLLSAGILESGRCRELKIYSPDEIYVLKNTFSQVNVQGKVTDESNAPLPGVSVLIKDTNKGTITDANGAYSLAEVPNNATLVFSYIGYISKEIPVDGKSTINVQLLTSSKSLEEVVVVGYGTKKRKDLTGSFETISSEDFNKGPVTTPEQLITGKVAGVQITSNGGAPGSGSQILIRGGASLNANNEPLIVLDGVPLESSTYKKVEGGKITSISSIQGQDNPLSFINPNDIESFYILKDASATAIYGSRASNGVIIITTKKGQQGKPKITFSTLFSVPQKIGEVNVLSASQFREVIAEQVQSGFIGSGQQDLLGDINTVWQDQVYRNPISSDNNLSLSGVLQDVPYRFSFGYLANNGILLTSSLDRTSGSIGLSPMLFKDHLKVDLNVKGAIAKSRFGDKAAIGAAVAFDPTQSITTENPALGNYFEWLDPATGELWTLGTRNPVSMLNQKVDEGDVKRTIGNAQLDYKLHFLPDLRAILNLGLDYSKSDGVTNVAPTAGIAYYDEGTSKNYFQSKRNKLLEFYLNYVKDLKSAESRFDITGGYSYQDFFRHEPEQITYKGTGLNDTIAPFKTQNTLISFFGRLNYAYKDRYLLTATVRRDGSSRFNPDNRWGTFPSAALAWRIIEEPFMKKNKVFSDLKLRFGFGVTGQQDVFGDYPYLPRYTFSDPTAEYQFGNTFYTTLRPEGYDSNIKWEETTTYNAGLDFGFLRGKITGSLDYYYKKTEDLLSIIPVAAGSNLTNQILTNVGDLKNQGVEFVLNATPVQKNDLTWSLGFNATYNENEITNLTKVNDPTYQGVLVGDIAGGIGNTIQIHTVGQPTFAFYVLKQVYDQNGKPLEGVYVDLNGDGVININDRYRYKSPNPKVILGFNSQLNYKQWNLSFVLRANIGNYMYNNFSSNNGAYRSLSFSNYLANLSSSVLETNFREFQLFSDYYIENASFLKMDNIRVGYDLTKVLKNKVNLVVSADVQNVFIVTNYSGLDPEIVNGVDNNFYPRSRVYSIGLNLSF